MATKREHDASKVLQSEPLVSKLDPLSDDYTITLMRLNNWYSTEKTRSDSYKYYQQYVKKNRPTDVKYFAEVEERDVHITYGWMARMLLQGAIVSTDHQKAFDKNLTGLIDLGKARLLTKETTVKVAVATTTVKRTSIQDAMKEKASEYVGELEGFIDEFVTEDKEFNLYNHLKGNQIPAPYVITVKSWAESKLTEFEEVVDSKDSQIVEGYSNFNKRKLKSMVKMFESFIADCDKYGQFKKANRKPRAVREKPAVAQVKSLKYKLKDEELGLTSARGIDLVGAEQVWLFNTKTRKLAVYTSESTKGMTVKGTTLQNWSPEKSKQKTLRKPEEQIKDLMASGKVKLRTFLDSIKSKEQAVNGRINIDTIILKITR
jgi:hypothetical protein